MRDRQSQSKVSKNERIRYVPRACYFLIAQCGDLLDRERGEEEVLEDGGSRDGHSEEACLFTANMGSDDDHTSLRDGQESLKKTSLLRCHC